MRKSHALAACIGMLLGLPLTACRTRPAQSGAVLRPAAACLIPAPAAARAKLTVAVAHAPRPAHAPIPANDSERLLFRQLYETLVTVDCEGRVLPALAHAWTSHEGGRVWEFRLRADARFWDGSPVTADDVVRSWAAAGSEMIAIMTALGKLDLRVELHTATSDAHAFAQPELAVARRGEATTWPLGTGAYRIEGGGDANVLRVVSRATRMTPDTIEFRVMQRADPRAPLDAGVDAFVTADATALAYARALSDYTITPLVWRRTYAVVTRRFGTTADSAPQPPADALLALARDAVRADTRPAQPPFWWQDPECRARSSPMARTGVSSTDQRAIVYPRADGAARDIAERLVALAWPPARTPPWLRALLPVDAGSSAPRALGLDERALLASLRAGSALAFVVPLPYSSVSGCNGLHRLDPVARATVSTAALHITPLLDARDHLVHRRGIGGAVIESDGVIRFTGGLP